jgi:NitT/TauT family transport system substrate-binding protein
MALQRSSFLAGSAAAFAAAALPRTPAVAQSLTDVTVLFPRLAPGSDYSFLWAADALGFFRAEGLRVAVQPTGGSPEAVRLVAAGQGDIALAGAEATIAAAAKGLPVRDVFTIQQKMIYSVGSLESGSMRSAADFKGKRVGVQSLTASPVFVARAIFREAGLNPDRDVTFVPIGVGGQAVVAVKSGQVDGVAFHDTQFVVFRDNGVPFRLLPAPGFKPYFTAGLVVKTDAVPQRGPVIAGFCRAIAKALVYSFANPAASIKQMTQLVPETNKDPIEALAVLKERLTFEGLPAEAKGAWGWNSPSRYQKFADFLQSVGVIDQKIDAAVIFDPRFLQRANAFDVAAIERMARSA